MAERVETDEGPVAGYPWLRRAVVAPTKNAATTEEPGPDDDEPVEQPTVSVELTPDGAHIHLT